MAAFEYRCYSCLRAQRLQSLRAPSIKSPRNFSRPLTSTSMSINTPLISKRLLPIAYTNRHGPRLASTAATTPNKPPPPSQPSNPDPPDEPTKPLAVESTQAQDITSTLFKECARQADYIIPQAFEAQGSIPKTALGEDIGQGSGFWYESYGFALTPTFNTWAQITFLHMWLLVVRLRYLEQQRSTLWQQHLTDHFFWEAEHRMSLFHKIDSSSIRQRYLKDVYNQWRGAVGAYDEGLVRGDAVLGAAVWRNVFRAGQGVGGVDVGLGTLSENSAIAVDRGVSSTPGAGQMSRGEETGAAATAQDIVEGDPEKLTGATKEVAKLTQAEEEARFDWRRVACVVAFMRRGLNRLDKAPDNVILEGKIRFGEPLREWESVTGVQSKGLEARFDQADEQALESWKKGELEI